MKEYFLTGRIDEMTLTHLRDANIDGDTVVRIHSYGGDVYSGMAIYNAIKEKEVKTVHVDGLSASMASYIMLAAQKVKMSNNAMVMIHQPRISFDFSLTTTKMAENIAILKKLEDSMILDYSSKMNLSAEDFSTKYFDGKDHYFTAKEALAVGLIDEIVNSTLKKEDKKLAASGEPDITAIYNSFSTINNQKQNMDKDFKTIISQHNLGCENSAEAVATALSERLTAIETERKKEVTAVIERELTGAITAGKITADAKENFRRIGETAGIATLQTALSSIPERNPIVAQIGTPVATKTDRDSWTYEQWLQGDVVGLELMKVERPDQYKTLYAQHLN